MNEKQVENKLTAAVKKAGGIAPKFVSPGFAGMPDRLILLPDGHIAFAELKAPGKLPRPPALKAPAASALKAPAASAAWL
jgi:hypothetical protein